MKKKGPPIFKLPKKIPPKSMFDFEIELMKKSLSIEDDDSKTKKEILTMIDARNVELNKKPRETPPLPCDFVKTDKKWMGHGFFYKSGEGKTKFDKCLGCTDFDSFDNFCRLKCCSVVLADYDSIRRDFICVKGLKNEEIDQWLISQFGYISTGQILRLKEGNLKGLLDDDWPNRFDEKDTKVGLRQRGGGRACSFFVDDSYSFDSNGRINATLMDCKGNGTSSMQQPEVKVGLCGFLSYVMALKGFVFERGVRNALESVKCKGWSTVPNYAILDIGIPWKDHNPATGIKGDRRNVIMLRQAHSRYSGRSDDAVYYSIVQMEDLKSKPQGKELLRSFRDVGLSSEQIPLSTEPISWNIQCNATFNRLVDFSHWYFLPTAVTKKKNSILPAFRMTQSRLQTCLQLQGKYILDHPKKYPSAMNIGYNTISEKEAKKIYELKKQELQRKAGKFGFCGEGKSRYSWSWMVELDDSEVYTKILLAATKKRMNGRITMEMIENWFSEEWWLL